MSNLFISRPSLFSLLAASALVVGCNPTQEIPSPSVGKINVQRYLAVGDSYTSGFSDGGLTRTGQENSFPALLAQVFQRAGGGPFLQPLLEPGTGTGYRTFTSFGPFSVPFTARVAGASVQDSVANPNACGGASSIYLFKRWTAAGPLPDNLGVPGLQLSQVQVPRYGNAAAATPNTSFNPYFERLLPAADSRTYLNAVTKAARSATFFTYFAGLDDLLPYLRSGATCGAFPSQTTFANALTAKARVLLDSLRAGGKSGIVVELPQLNALPLLALGNAVALQNRLQLASRDTSLRVYVYNSRLPGPGPSGRGKILAAAENDYILATALPRIGKPTSVMVNGNPTMLPYGLDIRNPVQHADVIDYSEYSVLNGIVTTHNGDLLALTQTTYKMPKLSNTSSATLLNITSSVFLKSAATVSPISLNGVQYSTDPVRGGIVSLDYYSLTPKGYGLLANAFIQALNYGYDANLPTVDINNLPTTAK